MVGPRPDEFTARAHGHPAGTIDVRKAALMDAWLGKLGPGATVTWQYLARRLAAGQEVFTIAELADYTGLMTGKVWGALDRLVRFSRIQWVAGDVLSVEVVTPAPVVIRRVAS